MSVPHQHLHCLVPGNRVEPPPCHLHHPLTGGVSAPTLKKGETSGGSLGVARSYKILYMADSKPIEFQ